MPRFKNALEKYNYYSEKINEGLRELSIKAPESKALERYAGEFEPITSDRPNARMVQRLAKEAQRVYESGATSLEGHERSVGLAIDKLHKEGLDFINRKNFGSFMDFMHDAQARGLGSLFTSSQIIQAIHDAKKKGLSKADIMANIDYWASKRIKYDQEGQLIEPDEYKPLKVVSGKRLENFKQKARARARREAKGGRR